MNTQKGFSTLIGLLLVTVIIGGVFYFYLSANKEMTADRQYIESSGREIETETGNKVETSENYNGTRTLLTGNLKPSRYDENAIRYNYSKNSTNVFYKNEKIIGADLDSFQVIENGNYEHWYARDKYNIYFKASPIIGVDLTSHVILWKTRDEGCPESHYSKDFQTVFFENRQLFDIDLASFQIYTGGYAKDKNHVFKDGVIQTNVNPDTFDFESVCQYG